MKGVGSEKISGLILSTGLESFSRKYLEKNASFSR